MDTHISSPCEIYEEISVRIDSNNRNYDTGIHPDVVWIDFKRKDFNDFFKGNRFPNIQGLVYAEQKPMTNYLKLECPSLEEFYCDYLKLEKLDFSCPRLHTLSCHANRLSVLIVKCPLLKKLNCSYNRLTILELECPVLQELKCESNHLNNLNGLEFCSELAVIRCSIILQKTINILKIHLPDLSVDYYDDSVWRTNVPALTLK
jgi:hypothetical protein